MKKVLFEAAVAASASMAMAAFSPMTSVVVC